MAGSQRHCRKNKLFPKISAWLKNLFGYIYNFLAPVTQTIEHRIRFPSLGHGLDEQNWAHMWWWHMLTYSIWASGRWTGLGTTSFSQSCSKKMFSVQVLQCLSQHSVRKLLGTLFYRNWYPTEWLFWLGVFASLMLALGTKTARIPVVWRQLFITYSVEELQIQNLGCLLFSQPLGTIPQVKGSVGVSCLTPTFCRTLGFSIDKCFWQHLEAAGWDWSIHCRCYIWKFKHKPSRRMCWVF